MKTLLSGTAVAIAAALLISASTAQQTAQQQRKQVAHSGNAIVRASDVIGMDVRNNADEDLGSIEDLAINPTTGKIEYAAVSMGGFLGMGDKLFAVPWNAIQCRTETGEEDQAPENQETVAVLDVDKAALKNAKGFDQDNWPDMANDSWRLENDRPYQSRRDSGQPVR